MQDAAFFVGTFSHKLDGKGRISVPARWRAELGDESNIYISSAAQDRVIECVAQADLRRRSTEQIARTDISQRIRGLLGVNQFHSYSAQPFDAEGRIQLPGPALNDAQLAEKRDQRDRSGEIRSVYTVTPKTTARLLGAGDRFYVLHPDNEQSFLEQALAEAEAIEAGSGT